MNMRRSALTLVEVLVACALMTAVVLALGTWARLLGRSTALASERTREQRQWSAVVRLIREDLTGLIGGSWYVDTHGKELRFTSSGSLPGTPRSINTIRWFCGDDGLQRSVDLNPDAREDTSIGSRLFPGIALKFDTSDSGQLWLSRAGTREGEPDRRVALVAVEWLR